MPKKSQTFSIRPDLAEATGAVFVNQSVMDGMVKRTIDIERRAGVPDEHVSMVERELHGGNCPVCGKPYEKKHAVNVLADFVWFKPTCTCEADRDNLASAAARLEESVRKAGVPRTLRECSFDSWDYSVDEATNKAYKLVFEFCQKAQYKTRGLVLYGAKGTGKTHCAIAALREISKNGQSTRYVATSDLVGQLIANGEKYAAELQHVDALLLDDMDKIGSTDNAWVKERIFSLFNGRLAEGRVIIVTSNLPDEAHWVEKFGEAVVSRMIDACDMIRFDGKDYRARRAGQREKKKRG